MRTTIFLSISTLTLAMAFSGCGDGAPGGPNLDELYAQGLTRFVGAFDPANSPDADENGVKHFEFEVPAEPLAEPRGPLCLRGTEYTVDTRAGSSNNLVIYLQGGGACWQALCSAFEEAGPLTPGGILNPDMPNNPLADWDLVYLPYCDGSLFAGDVDRFLPPSSLGEGDEDVQSYQRGLQNLSAALDVAVSEFPAPDRIMLAGISGGGFGTITATPLVRAYYPDAELLVFNDSGVGVAKDGNPGFINMLLDEWNASQIIPASCIDCTSDGHITPFVEWTLEADPNLRVSALSYSEDFVVALQFLELPPSSFVAPLLRETGRIAENFPDRYKRFIADGTLHTVLLNDGSLEGEFADILGSLEEEIDGVTVLEWLTAMLDDTEDWKNLVAEGL